jgi:glycoside/pentoside/hexuronide:cation symporter, GPH family
MSVRPREALGFLEVATPFPPRSGRRQGFSSLTPRCAAWLQRKKSFRSQRAATNVRPVQPPSKPSGSDRLKLTEYVGYAVGDTASNLFFQTFNVFLTYYYVDVWGLAAAAVAQMMLLVRFSDAVADPVMGMIADRTHTRWGKFRPYILFMAVPYGVAGYLIFANPELSPSGKLLYAYGTYTLMLFAYTGVNVPYSSLLGVMSSSSETRTVASSFRFVGAFGGGLLISLLVRPLVKALGAGDEVSGFQQTMAMFAVLSVFLFWITFATTRERVTPPADQKTNVREELLELARNRPWMILLVATVFSTSFIGLRAGSTIFYFKYVVGDDGSPVLFGTLDRVTVFLASGSACMMLGSACLGLFARMADKRTLAVILTLITAGTFALFFIVPSDNFGLQLALNAFGTFAMGPTSALVWAMYADVADYGEWKFGRRSTGLVYSASLFALKTGTMVAGWMLPLFLDRFGFVRNVQQSAGALLGITLAFSIVPGIFATLKAAALWAYPLSRREVLRIEGELDARRQPAAATPA